MSNASWGWHLVPWTFKCGQDDEWGISRTLDHRNPDRGLEKGSRHTSKMVAVGEARRYGEIC